MKNMYAIYCKVYERANIKHQKNLPDRLSHIVVIEHVTIALICGYDRNASVIMGGAVGGSILCLIHYKQAQKRIRKKGRNFQQSYVGKRFPKKVR